MIEDKSVRSTTEAAELPAELPEDVLVFVSMDEKVDLSASMSPKSLAEFVKHMGVTQEAITVAQPPAEEE